MASRRKLKKTINFVASELVTDIYFRCLMSKDVDSEKVEKVVVDVMELKREYTLRANCPDGKDNPKIVKSYFRKYFSDWKNAMEKVIADIDGI